MGETSGQRGGPPYWFIVGFEQKMTKRGGKGSRKTRNLSSQHVPHPHTGPPKRTLSAQNCSKEEKFRTGTVLPNSETGEGSRALGRLNHTFCSKR